jgi:hypothetical protein
MTVTNKGLELMATMFERREDARRLFGERYVEKVAPWKQVVRAVAKKQACGFLQAACAIADPKERGTHLRDFDVLLLNAATLELMEEKGNHC